MKKIIVNKTKHGIWTAVVKDMILHQLFYDSFDEPSLVGSIYKSKIVKLNYNMAFADIGEKSQVFLDLNDVANNKAKLKQGDEVVLQISKDKIDSKLAVAKLDIVYKGRFLILSKIKNNKQSINFSSKLLRADCEKLEHVILKYLPQGYDVIIRTAAANASENDIKNEFIRLLHEIDSTANLLALQKTPANIKMQDPIVYTLLDVICNNTQQIVFDCITEYDNILKALPELADKLIYFNEREHVFERYFIKTQFDKVFEKKIWLKSGGYIIIEQTAACVCIDVNTGKYIHGKNKKSSILKINKEAAVEIPRQLRLRNLSGIIIIDFINMDNQENIELITSILAEGLKEDHVSAFAVGMTELGLMQVTRKRIKPPHAPFI